ncbi:MAG TPA: hypothetical protein VGR87_15435 [Candidatus Limnocylindria bacterium]|nr:hypothetical protein [Candidatus Limnocylindria bacterium]
MKRAELELALGAVLPELSWPGSSNEELAWAGGFFDGEGSTYLLKHRTHVGYLVPVIEVPQSGWEGAPEVLLRFQRALDGVGPLYGPYVSDSTEAPVSRWKCAARDDLQLVIHPLMPFIGSVKREQARAALRVANTQPDLPRGNPAFGVAGARYCRRGQDRWNVRIGPFKGRGRNVEDPLVHLRQCLQCVRDGARRKKKQRP